MTGRAHTRVLVTRPAAQAQAWRKTLAQHGFDSIAVPMLELAPVSAREQVEALKARVLDFDHYQKVVFVSRNAVAHAMGWLDRYWPQLPVGIEYFGVGSTTAEALRELNLPIRAPGGAMNSEALLLDPALQTQQVTGQRVLIFRGVGGRPYLAQELEQRGARVDFAELYERLHPKGATEQLGAAFADPEVLRQKQIVALHSGESLHNYRKSLDELAEITSRKSLTQMLEQLPVLVPGQRVAELAQDLGFAHILTAENATDASMLATLKQH